MCLPGSFNLYGYGAVGVGSNVPVLPRARAWDGMGEDVMMTTVLPMPNTDKHGSRLDEGREEGTASRRDGKAG